MAQSLPAFLAAYDRTALMAMPLMEGAADVNAFLQDLVRRVAAQPEGLARTVFELQAVDWRGGASRPVPAPKLRTQLRMLARLGVRHMGWYPDDFIRNQPEADVVRDAISTRSFPARP